MSRRWNELVASLADLTPGGVSGLAFGLLLIAAVVAVLWYTWPPRLSWGGGRHRHGRRSGSGRWRRPRWHWPRWRWRWSRWRWRWPRWLSAWRRRTAPPEPDQVAPDELPDLPAEVLALTADQLAAAGRYAEAVRERLRAIVRALIEAEVIEHRPGWTVTELADAGGRARPDTAAALRAAAELFSEIWYGQRPATSDDDRRMRGHAVQVRDALARSPVGSGT